MLADDDRERATGLEWSFPGVALMWRGWPGRAVEEDTLDALSVICCVAPAYMAKHGAPRHIEDLSRHNRLSLKYPGFTTLTREWHFTGPRGEVTVPISGNIHTNSTELPHAAVLDGRGIGLVPKYRAESDIGSGHLVRLFPEYRLGSAIAIVALYPNRQHLPMKVRSFIDFAVKHFARSRALQDRDISNSGPGPGAGQKAAAVKARTTLMP